MTATLPKPAESYVPAGSRSVHPWLALVALCLGQLMVEIDDSVTNIALPTIERSLRIDPAHLPWVVNAYVLCFGGVLLLGGRLADRYGRRRVLMTGLALFVLTSLCGGLAQGVATITGARAGQGLAAALLAPSAMSMLVSTFPQERDRTRALAVWGAVTGSGAVSGLLVGGFITETLGWRWVFFGNAAVALAALTLAPVLLPESRIAGRRPFDLAGAVTGTAGLIIAVYSLDAVREHGWTSPAALVWGGAALVLLTAFVLIEARHRTPLLPLALFRLRRVAVADTVALLIGAGMLSSFYFLSLYVQQVLGFSPMRAAVSYLPMALALAVGAGIGTPVLNRYGPRPVLTAGPLVAGTGLALFARIHDGGGYLAEVLPAMLAIGFGLGVALVAVTAGSVHGVPEHDSGLASGLFNTAIQIGGGLGLAVLGTVAAARTDHVLAGSPQDPVRAMTEGFATAMTVGGGLVAAAALVAFAALRGESSV